VRQHFLLFLVNDLHCPASLIAVEKALTLHGLSKRADLVVHGTDGAPLALVECKAPSVKLDQAVFEQAARYNVVFRVAWLFVTNGLQHYCCRIEHSTGAVHFLPEMPGFAAMTAAGRA
jgi:type I site-specific restriction endonuclease